MNRPRALLAVLAVTTFAACGSPTTSQANRDDESLPPTPFIGIDMPGADYPWRLGEELQGVELERLGSNEATLFDGDTRLLASGGSHEHPAPAFSMRSKGDPHLDDQGCTQFPIVAFNWAFQEVDRLPPGTCFDPHGETWEYHWELLSDRWSDGLAPNQLTVVNNTRFAVSVYEHVFNCDRIDAFDKRGLTWRGDTLGGDPNRAGRYPCVVRLLQGLVNPSESVAVMPFDRDPNECTVGLFAATWEDPPPEPPNDALAIDDDAEPGVSHVVYHDIGICLRDGPVTWTIEEAAEVEPTADPQLPNLDARYAAEAAAADAAQATTTRP